MIAPVDRTPNPLSSYRFIELHWNDAAHVNQWADLDNDIGPQTCLTRGWLMQETKDNYIVAMTLGVAGKGVVDMNGVAVIPRGMVTKIRDLTPRRKRDAPTKADSPTG